MAIPAQIKTLLSWLKTTRDSEISCDDCLADMAEYLEAELESKPGPPRPWPRSGSTWTSAPSAARSMNRSPPRSVPSTLEPEAVTDDQPEVREHAARAGLPGELRVAMVFCVSIPAGDRLGRLETRSPPCRILGGGGGRWRSSPNIGTVVPARS